MLNEERKILFPFLLLILLFLHLSLRYNTFWLSHVAGDQNQYIGLAMKLEKFGFNGYSLRGIDLVNADREGRIVKILPSKDKEGSLLRGLKETGAGYYDIPFFHKGPGLPIALMLSHRIFNPGKEYLLVAHHIGKEVFKTRPKEYASAQFYAVIVPLFFSTILIFLTFCSLVRYLSSSPSS